MATDDGTPPRKPTSEEVNARFARLCVGAPPSKERDEELAQRIGSRRRGPPPPIDDAHLNEIVQTTTPPTAREAVADRRAAAAVPAHLAEAQVSLVGRCTLCGKPVTGRDVPRDRHGRPRHHRCPP